jgi:hypothetical protein
MQVIGLCPPTGSLTFPELPEPYKTRKIRPELATEIVSWQTALCWYYSENRIVPYRPKISPKYQDALCRPLKMLLTAQRTDARNPA